MYTSLSDERVYAWENIELSYTWAFSYCIYYTPVLCYIRQAPLDVVLQAGFSLSDGSPLLENAPGVYSNCKVPPAAGIYSRPDAVPPYNCSWRTLKQDGYK
jgi:hypothetical protein